MNVMLIYISKISTQKYNSLNEWLNGDLFTTAEYWQCPEDVMVL